MSFPFPLLADAEFLYADNGISFDGVLRYDSGRPWKRFEILFPWAQNTLDFARIEISIDAKAIADGMAYFFPGGAHIQFRGEELAGSAQLEFEDKNRIELKGMVSVGATIYGFELLGGLTRDQPEELGNVVSLRKSP